MARKATIVLPLPTSPCSRRCIGWVPAKSFSISAPTEFCPAVSTNGSRLSNAVSIGPSTTEREVAVKCAICFRRWARTTCSTNASSNLSRARATPTSAKSAGRWIRRSARVRSANPSVTRTCSGIGSATSPNVSSTIRTAPAICQEVKEPVAG